jgi:hypothetical protein
MATFRTYAEILTAHHIQWKAYTAGITDREPGVVLQDILERNGGVYENKLDLTPKFRDEVRNVAELTGDDELMEIADLPAVSISLEHLRDVDPQTRIVCGYRLDYTAEESTRLGLDHKGPYDPSKTICLELDPSNDMRAKPD